MIMLRTVGVQGDTLSSLLKQRGKSDFAIILCENINIEIFNIESHPEGIIIRNGEKFLLNGRDLIYEGPFDQWEAHPKGIVTRVGKDFFLNGRKLLYQGDYDIHHDEWQPDFNLDGLIIRRKNNFFLNGEKLLYQGPCDEWKAHPDGFVIRIGDEFWLISLSKKELLYKGEWTSWDIYPGGMKEIIICHHNYYFWIHYPNNQKKLILSKRITNNWRAHNDGIITTESNEAILYLITT